MAKSWGLCTGEEPTYEGVLPRDLFNEAKLLKCMGRLVALLIHEGKLPLAIAHDAEQSHRFLIEQDRSSGDIFVSNMTVTRPDGSGLDFSSLLNSRRAYPLVCIDPESHTDVVVFDGLGKPTADFVEMVNERAAT